MRRKPELRVVVIVQARMGSTRLSGKIFKQVLGRPLLDYEIERILQVHRADEIVIATTDLPEDKPVLQLADELGVQSFAGSSQNVLKRYLDAAIEFKADLIVRICGDCPLIDPSIVEKVIDYYLENYPKFSYVSNTIQRTFPRGMDTEVFDIQILKELNRKAKHPEEFEHVTTDFLYNSQNYSIGYYKQQQDESMYRLTVDTEEDFQLIKNIIDALYPSNPHFSCKDIIAYLKLHPDILKINAGIQQKILKNPSQQ